MAKRWLAILGLIALASIAPVSAAKSSDGGNATTAKRAGADWWSLQPVRRPEIPRVAGEAQPANPIDAFIRQTLAGRGLSPNPPADRRTLIRRAYFDLIGLPPTPEDVDAFLQDKSVDAYEKVIDRLLASPQYGVRWARHWLDVARFGESNGFEYDEFRPQAWRYRDWVVDALNRDLPYDEFAREQLAGDVMHPQDPQAIVATGFIVAGPYDVPGQKQQSIVMRSVVRQDELEDVIATVGQAFLGLTVQCARCHNHKFDPIQQAEYYKLEAALAGVRHGERDLKEAGKAYVVVPREPAPTHVLIRGNPAQPGDLVVAGGVAAICGVNPDFSLPPDAPEGVRREKLAGWISDPANPLFSRVIANRLWHYHFGVGLVDTPSDFGFNGGRPSHPQLLDFLASELVQRHFSLKQMHKLIMTSQTYQQSSANNPAAAKIDAGDRLLWRKSMQRLDAEALRDSVLAVAGQLRLTLGGPGFRDFKTATLGGQKSIVLKPLQELGDDTFRRTLYRTWARGGRSGLLDALDCPDPSTATPARQVTNTPLQALAMLNNVLILRMSEEFAGRLEHESADVGAQVDLAYRLALARSPDADEQALAREVIAKYGLKTLTRALFNSSEFLFVD